MVLRQLGPSRTDREDPQQSGGVSELSRVEKFRISLGQQRIRYRWLLVDFLIGGA